MENKYIVKEFDIQKITDEREDIDRFLAAYHDTDENGNPIKSCISRHRALILKTTSNGLLISLIRNKLMFEKYKSQTLQINQCAILSNILKEIFDNRSIKSLVVNPATKDDVKYFIIEMSEEICNDDDGAGGDGLKIKIP